ncbi:Gfo/Idh/MocA family protein [Opitutus terrae]|uniref:Oxidoreductase domain protein n=1 Tax=Opitutus terrae (strain DSM 11246 / JCM 15787 / PB90-1) TaxID=452637 RepID=B1ZWW5_OPITP|nr:Gfo/Idh/MocA family oxidoreductase [Opitutus terrae]ACB75076.1 oxidoreductase domain protein [Opitutus terrae PB90-1]
MPSPALFNISRRAFLKRCATVAAATGLPLWYVSCQHAPSAAQRRRLGPNDRPRLALIGCGGMGRIDGANASNHGDIVAVCDVDANHVREAVEKFRTESATPEGYGDFRRVLERSDIDAVINVTPDHWHTLINVAAAKAGKDVYAEKPLTLTIGEGRHVVQAVRDAGVVLQTGTQQRSSPRFRLACELVRNGRIGQLQEANVWLPAGLHEGPFDSASVPAGLNWDFWQGQAPAVDYVPQRCHGTFRFWYEYSGGTMTDWGAHHNDIAYWAVGLIAPTRVESTRLTQPIPGGYTAYSDYEVRYTYENGVKLNIRTTKDDSIYGDVINKDGQRNGIRFVGSNGWIWVNRKQITASDPDLLKTPLPENAERLYRSDDHWQNFVDCLRSRARPICDVETGHRSATMCHLGAISLRTGRALTWDYQQEKFVGEHAAEANTYLVREMRKPYDFNFA